MKTLLRKLGLLTLFATLLPVSLSATVFYYSYEGRTLGYTVLDEAAKTCEVTTYYDSNGTENIEVIIPETAEDIVHGESYTVVSIADRALKNCPDLTALTIPKTVTNISKNAFGLYNESLKKLTLSDGEKPLYMGYEAFPNKIETLYLGRNYTAEVNYYPFAMNTLTQLTIGNSVTSIPAGCFSSCSGLTSIVIPNSVTSIGEAAFSGCI